MGQARVSDIARALGISKASVSLALNNKPGVSDATRQMIFDCKKRLESEPVGGNFPYKNTVPNAGRLQINVLMVSGGMHIVRGSELGEIELGTDVKKIFDSDFRSQGYTLGLIYLDVNHVDEIRAAIASCNESYVAGVILFATELFPGQVDLFRDIRKPMVVYDFMDEDSTRPLSYISINNRQAVRLALNELTSAGLDDIRYLSMTTPMYNYESRKRGFIYEMRRRGLSEKEAAARLISCPGSIDGAYKFMLTYLKTHDLPRAFIAESYHLSIGTIRAMSELHIKIPDDVSLIGIDRLPDYLTAGLHMTSIRVPHTVRAHYTTEILMREIKDPNSNRVQLYVDCTLSEGETVKKHSAGEKATECTKNAPTAETAGASR